MKCETHSGFWHCEVFINLLFNYLTNDVLSNKGSHFCSDMESLVGLEANVFGASKI